MTGTVREKRAFRFTNCLSLFERADTGAELQKSCGYAGTTLEEGLPYVRSLRKVSTFNQQISAKSAGTGNYCYYYYYHNILTGGLTRKAIFSRALNKKPILNNMIHIFCSLKVLTRIILRKI